MKQSLQNLQCIQHVDYFIYLNHKEKKKKCNYTLVLTEPRPHMGEELPYCEFPGIYLFIYLSIYNIFRQGNLNQERPIFQQGPVLHMILP